MPPVCFQGRLARGTKLCNHAAACEEERRTQALCGCEFWTVGVAVRGTSQRRQGQDLRGRPSLRGHMLLAELTDGARRKNRKKVADYATGNHNNSATFFLLFAKALAHTGGIPPPCGLRFLFGYGMGKGWVRDYMSLSLTKVFPEES